MAYGLWKQPNEDPDYYVVTNPTPGELSPQERLAQANNETFKSNNGSYPDCPSGPHGIYSTGKRYD